MRNHALWKSNTRKVITTEKKGVEVPVTQVVPKQVYCVYVCLTTCEILRPVNSSFSDF